MIPKTIPGHHGEIRMRWPDLIPKMLIIFGLGIPVRDDQGEGGARATSFEQTGKTLHPVLFVTRSGHLALARATPIKLGLNLVQIKD
jgi:hypothetical protein